jgi:hypothetical protein
MKKFITVVLAGGLAAIAAFADSTPRDDAGTKKSALLLPFRPYQKRPVGTTMPSATKPATVATPALPFRPVQKRPTASPAKSSNQETSASVN